MPKTPSALRGGTSSYWPRDNKESMLLVVPKRKPLQINPPFKQIPVVEDVD